MLTCGLQPSCPDLAFIGQLLLAIWINPLLISSPAWVLVALSSLWPRRGFSAQLQARQLSPFKLKVGERQVSQPESGKGAEAGVAYRLTAAARIPMLVSFGGAEEWRGVMFTCSMRSIAPFSVTAML